MCTRELRIISFLLINGKESGTGRQISLKLRRYNVSHLDPRRLIGPELVMNKDSPEAG